MKVIAPVLFLFCFAKSSLSQNYSPLPDSNCVWSVSIFKYTVKGDSVINSKKYKKYYVSLDSTLSPQSLYYSGLVRQDIPNKKIYGIGQFSSSEHLSYDFGLNVNDTARISGVAGGGNNSLIKVVAKDSILIAGLYRKRLKLISYNPQYSNGDEFWIEGIGSLFGPLQSGACESRQTDTRPCLRDLLCQKVGTALTYINPVYNSCYFNTDFKNCPVGIGEIYDHAFDIKFHPNPVEDKIIIESEFFDQRMAAKNELNFKVVNTLSQLLLAAPLVSPIIKVADLSQGIYFLQIYEGRKLLGNQKFFKN
jgi:hypothetical protein